MASVTRQPDTNDFFEPSLGAAPSTPEPDEISAAAWKLTPTAGIVDWFETPSYPTDPEFKPDMNTLDRKYWPAWDELENAGSLDEFRNIQLRQVENDDAWQSIAEGGPSAMATAIGYDMLDPATMPFWFIPFVGQGGRFANMARGASAIATEMGVRESIAHFQQPSRKLEQSVPIVIGATALGAAMGAALRPSIKNVPTEAVDNMINQQDKVYKGVVADSIAEGKVGVSGGAAKTTVYGKPARIDEEMAVAPKHVRKVIIRAPKNRLDHSANDYGMAEPSAIGDELVRSHVPKARDDMGISPVYPNGKMVPFEEEVDRIRKAMPAVAETYKKKAISVIKDKTGLKASRTDVDELIERMALYGDEFWIPQKMAQRLPGIEKAIKDLEPIAQEFLELQSTFTRRMEKVGWFGFVKERVKNADGSFKMKKNGRDYVTTNKLDVDGNPIKATKDDVIKYAPNWMHTIYSKKAIRDNPADFSGRVVKGYQNPERAVKTGLDPDLRTFDELQERGLDAISNATSSTKINPSDGGGAAKHFGPPGSKPVTLKVLRKDIDDYIIHSLDAQLNYLAKEVEPILAGLERYGDDGLKWSDKGIEIPALNARMQEEFLSKRSELAVGDSIAYNKLLKGYEQAVKDVQHIINKITGADRQLGIFDSKLAAGLNELRAAASFAWLGNVAIASVHEVARSQIFHGLGGFAKSMGVVINPTDMAKANIKKLRDYHMGLDLTSARSTAMIRAEIDEPVAMSGAGSFMSRNVNKIYHYTGLDYGVTKLKDVEAFAFMNDVVDFAIQKQKPNVGSGAYKSAMRRFTRYGITRSDLQKIAKQVSDGGFVQENGSWLINDAKFKDGKLLDKFRSITASAGESSLVTGGAGSLPIVLDNPIGRSIAQFKRVFFGYQDRLEGLALSLSEADARAAGGLMTSFALTWAAWQTRMFLKYMDDPSTAAENFAAEWNASPIQDHIWQMINRTGYTGLALIGLEQMDKATKGGLSHAINTNVGSKHFKGDGTVVANLIPSLTYAEKLLSVMTAPLKEGGAKPRDVKTMTSLIPLNTLIGADQILDAIAKSVGTTIEEPSKKAKKAAESGVDMR